MTDKAHKNMIIEEVLRDVDEGLFAEIGPDHKFNRLRTTDRKRLARGAKLAAIRSIDISTGKTAVTKQYFDGLLDRVEGGIEGNCLVLHGRTGAGKTHIIRQLLKHPDLQEEKTPEGLYRPLLRVTAPSPCTLRTLGLRILRRLGYHPKKSLKEHEVWDRVEANLGAQGVAILVIDEMHNVLVGRNTDERKKIAMTLKSLMVSEDNPMQIVCAGLTTLQKFVKRYSELHRRSHFVELPPMDAVKDAKKITAFLTGLEKDLEIKTCGFTEHDMPHRFFLASRGLLGRMAWFAQEAATIAVSLDDDVVRKEYLAEAYKRPYAAGVQQNPFLLANYHDFKIPKKSEEIDDDDETFLKGTKPKRSTDDDADDDAD
jgi:hypothetical protein